MAEITPSPGATGSRPIDTSRPASDDTDDRTVDGGALDAGAARRPPRSDSDGGPLDRSH